MTKEEFIETCNKVKANGEAMFFDNHTVCEFEGIVYERHYHPNGMSARHTLKTPHGQGELNLGDIPDNYSTPRKVSYTWIDKV